MIKNMSHPTRETVFRAAALRHDEQPADKIQQPRLATPRGVILLWLLLGVSSAGGLATLLALIGRLAQ